MVYRLKVAGLLMAAGVQLWAAPHAAEIFGHQVLPILQARCVRCHGGEKTKADLNLTTLAGLMKGGTEGPAVIPGKSRESPLYRMISEKEMPPADEGEAVTYEEAQVIARWIDTARFPDVASLQAQAVAAVHERAKTLWSFQPVRRPALPEVKQADAVRTPVDRFVLAKLETRGAAMSREADPRTLARRVYFDLTGLPPTPEEVAAFETDCIRAPDTAFRELVERLLASPRYGERWGRHWLDVAGWAESSSAVSDPVRPGFWRYRDWVIRAFNADMPYDRFVREQLAGDELVEWRDADTFTPEMIDKLVATGFLRSTPDTTDNQFIYQEDKKYVAQQTTMEVSTKALLGLTMSCVRCHDHKYDPITQEEYYNLIAVFQPAFDPEKWIAGAVNKYGPGPVRVIPLGDRAQRETFEARLTGLKRQNEERSYLRMEGVPNQYRDRHLREQLDALPPALSRPAVEAALAVEDRVRTPEQKAVLEKAARLFGLDGEKLEQLYPEMRTRLDEVKDWGDMLAKQGLEVGDVLWALWDVSAHPTPTRLHVRGDFKNPGREVVPGVLRALDDPAAPWRPPAPPPDARTSGRRRAFAEWITRPEHPLTARVMVNRVWQYHFGEGIVGTPDDLGVRGARPTHPELLDWLASEFVASGWSLKHLHRLILNSATWRQRAAPDATTAQQAGQDYRAFPRRRLEAEAIRDAMLHVTGKLDLRMFGKSVTTQKAADGSFEVPAKEAGRFRRSVYLTTRRSQVPTLLSLFDAPLMDANWPKRSDSALASQSLALMNHPFVLECADLFAARLLAERDTDADRVDRLFALAFQRAPEPEEREAVMDIVGGSAKEASRAAWRTAAHALLATNEFLYLD